MGVVTGAFVLTCLVVAVAPGPSLAVIINQSALEDQRPEIRR